MVKSQEEDGGQFPVTVSLKDGPTGFSQIKGRTAVTQGQSLKKQHITAPENPKENLDPKKPNAKLAGTHFFRKDRE